jgi:hypothetical protein
VLAGSAAYAFGEAHGWKCGLENKPWEAVGFYSVITAATLLGIGIDPLLGWTEQSGTWNARNGTVLPVRSNVPYRSLPVQSIKIAPLAPPLAGR